MRLRHVLGTFLGGGLVFAIAISAEGRASIDHAPHVYAAAGKRPLVVGATQRAPMKYFGRFAVQAKPDMTDPWTGEPIVLPPRTIGLLAADRTDPWTGETLATPPARGPMPDDEPFGTVADRRDEKAAQLIGRPRVDRDNPF
jgi:hypothetical protein